MAGALTDVTTDVAAEGQPRPYLSAAQLAALTPWSVDAIRRMVRRRALRQGIHYFQPTGRGGQVLFKWAAIVELIEGRASSDPRVVDSGRGTPRRQAKVLHVSEAIDRASRMLR